MSSLELVIVDVFLDTLFERELAMDFLTEEQNNLFAETNSRFGLGPNEYTAELTPAELAELPLTRIMSSTGETHFPPHIISIGSVEEMRKIVGFTDEYIPPKEGSQPDYPVSPMQEEIDEILITIGHQKKPQISEDLMELIKTATMAYVTGDPSLVKAFVPLINATQFPGRAAVFTGEKLEIPKGATHIITGDDPVVLNYGHIIVAQGATMKVKTGVFINSQMFTQE